MKIDNTGPSQVSTGAAAQTGAVTQGQAGAGPRSRLDGQPDRVQLSNLSEALRDLGADDPGRAERLRSVEAAVRSGERKIDSLELGRSILGDSLELP